MSKRLPRTSRRTLDDLRKAAKIALDAQELPLPTAGPGPTARKRPAGTQDPERASPAQQETPRQDAGSQKTGQLPQPVPAAARSGSRERPSRAAFREASGRLIVEHHANFATVAGLIPLPWVDLVAITAIVDRMLRKLSRLYGRQLDGVRSKQLATAMLTGMAAPGIASFATTGLMSMLPGPNLVATAITSISAAVLVRIVGEVYLSHLASQAGYIATAGLNTANSTN